MANGNAESRFTGYKRTFEKPINISSQVLLDRERCVLCARCTRFADQIAGDRFITLNERGALQQVGIYEEQPFESYFSGNTVQICPVGALTGATYRFRARPFDLVSTPSACEHCASGCDMRTDVRRGKTLRRLAGEDPTVNDEWNCDKGRWAFKYQTAQDRITTPLVRNAAGELVPASWPEALEAAAAGLTAGRAAVLVGGRATVEDAYGYSKFARVTLGTNDVDFRSRVSSDEERAFLASNVIGNQTSYRDIDSADQVVLVSFEPEEESPIVFLRLNKAFRKRALKVHAVASKLSIGNEKLKANFICVAPGNEVAGLAGLTLTEKSVILVGERAAETAGLLTAVSALAARANAKLAWIPRRAGERGALEAGAIGNLLPGGRPVSDAAARVDISAAWAVHGLPEARGLSTDEIYEAAANGEINALLVGGVDPLDGSNPTLALAALQNAFVVSLEMRPSAVTDRANVVLPVAAVAEKSGTFLNWEGRGRSFDIAIPDAIQRSDLRILSVLADQIGRKIGISTVSQAAAELNSIGTWDGKKSEFGGVSAAPAATLSAEQALLTSWRRLLDNGSLQEGEANLAGTARKTVAVISPKRANSIGVTDGELVKISNGKGAVVLPVLIEAIHDDAVWAPRNSAGSELLRTLGVASNSVVTVVKA
jgi:NADH-quinone oxidoreductase subunit G